MPLYTYQCKECGVRFERQQSFHDAPISVCPECEGEVYRVIGATGVIFKGSGFYVTDNRKSSAPASSKSSAAKSEGTSGSESTSSSSESSSSTPAATTSTSTPASSSN